MAPHILPQPLERLFPDRKKVGCVCDSRLERSGTQEPSWTQHVLPLHTKSCWNSTFQVIYSFFPVEFRQRKYPEALDVCLFLLFWCRSWRTADCLMWLLLCFNRSLLRRKKVKIITIMCCRGLEKRERSKSSQESRAHSGRMMEAWLCTAGAEVWRGPPMPWAVVHCSCIARLAVHTVQWICSAVQNLVISQLSSSNLLSLQYRYMQISSTPCSLNQATAWDGMGLSHTSL